MVTARIFISRPKPWFSRQIPVFICWCLCVSLQMVLFLLQFYLMGSKPCRWVRRYNYIVNDMNLMPTYFLFITFNKKALLCYYLCCRFRVSSFGSFFSFPSDPYFLCWFPCFLRRILSLLISPCGTACAVHEWAGWGLMSVVEAFLDSCAKLSMRAI